MNDQDFQSVLNKIEELQRNPLLPGNWKRIIAKRKEKSVSTIAQYAKGTLNPAYGPFMVLEEMLKILTEQREKAKKLTK